METLRYVVLVNGLLAVVSLAYYVFLRRETFFGANRLALWLGLTAALIMPLLELPDWRPQPVRAVMQRTAQVIVPKVLPNAAASQHEVTITYPNGQTFPAFQKTSASLDWSWQYGLVGLYVFGVLGLLIRLGRQLVSLGKLIRQSVHEPYDGFTLVRNEGITSPFSFFDWVVLNPDQHTPDELEQILRHERIHVRERHSFDMLGTELVCIVFWFNPAAYLFRHLLHQTLEFSADRAVLAEGVDATLYQYNLVKVSLSGGQSAITNHFSKTQLKSRIVMLNKSASSDATWLKYPVIFFAALTLASAFARPQHLKILSKYAPKPVAETLTGVAEPAKESIQSVVATKPILKNALVIPKPDKDSINELLAQPLDLQTNAVRNQPAKDPVYVSPSRYMVYQGDYLYWIVTPKTTIDDFAVMKQEFAKYGYQLQLNELKYDPFDSFIDRVMFKTKGPAGDVLYYQETQDDLKPIPIITGHIPIRGGKIDPAGSGKLEDRNRKGIPKDTGWPPTLTKKEFPDMLRNVAIDDENLTYQSIDDRKMDYMLLKGERKYGHLGMGFRRFDKEEIKKQSSPNSSISVKPDGSIVINVLPGRAIKAFINNEPVTLDDVQLLKISQVYTVAVIVGLDAATNKRTGTDYLFFYPDQAK